jgi:hypothetical protein
MTIILGDSGALTLGDVKAAIQAEGYAADTTAAQTELVRNVLRRVYGMRRWNFLQQQLTGGELQVTVANQGIVSLSNLGRDGQLDSVRIAQGTGYWDLDHLDTIELQRRRHLDRGAGTPQYWTQAGAVLLFHPFPSGTFDLEVTFNPIPVLPVEDDDAVAWPEAHLDVLVYGAIIRLCRRQRDWNGLDRARSDFADAVRDVMRDDEDTDRQTGLRVGGAQDYTDFNNRYF